VRCGWVVVEFGLGAMWSGLNKARCGWVVAEFGLGVMQSGYGWFSLVVLDIAGYFLSKSAEIKDD
jgi:hypothetical protein